MPISTPKFPHPLTFSLPLFDSYGQFNLTKAANRTVAGLQGDATTDISGGVVTVQVSSSTSQGDGMMVNDISRKITSAFGVQPSDLASHVLYCLPPNTMTGIAYAYIGSWLSVYSNEWCNYLSTQMREFEHEVLALLAVFVFTESTPQHSSSSFSQTRLVITWVSVTAVKTPEHMAIKVE